MRHLKQENDSLLQFNTEEWTFYLSFSIFTFLPLTCSRLKTSIALHALSWKYFALIEMKSCDKEILRDILWVKSTYLFVESLIIFIDNFLKNKNRYIVWRKWFYENSFPRGNSHPKNSHPSNTPLENSHLQKIGTQKILTWIITTHFINCLSSLKTLFGQLFTNEDFSTFET